MIAESNRNPGGVNEIDEIEIRQTKSAGGSTGSSKKLKYCVYEIMLYVNEGLNSCQHLIKLPNDTG
jgi:hypothetical protein